MVVSQLLVQLLKAALHLLLLIPSLLIRIRLM
nr:MAG TPA: hypothetical protein [Caudoviricetes sp.]